ncbi:MAG: segregation/condensation protein A, partial [Halobacteria archaeon]|nr:segregation/condensation protein A [Halobacteria archaeon]
DHIDDVWDRVSDEFEARDELLFRELIGGESTKTDVVTTYLSLLFLATRGELSLEQDDFYGDLWVKKESEV